MAQDGFQATVAQVAVAAGRSPGSLHRHFATKDDLLLAALDHARAALMAPGPALGDTLHARLRQHWHALGYQALAQPLAFRYWALYLATPGLPPTRLPRLERRLLLFRGADAVLAAALGQPALGTWAATLLVATWESTVAELLARRAEGPDEAAELDRGFAAWWAGLDLADDTPLRTPPA